MPRYLTSHLYIFSLPLLTIGLWCFAFSLNVYASTPINLNVVIPEESIGPFISEQPEPSGKATSNKTGLINQLLDSLEIKSNLSIEFAKLPTLRAIEKITRGEIDNWITFSTDGSVTLTGLQNKAPVDLMGMNATVIPIAGFDIKLWTTPKNIKSYTSANSFAGKTVLITRNFHYTEFSHVQSRLGLIKKHAPSLPSAVKMTLSNRADFLLSSEPTIFWNLGRLKLSPIDLQPVDFPDNLSLSTNIFIIFDKRLPKEFSSNFIKHIQTLEKNGKLQEIRSKLKLTPPKACPLSC